MEAPGGLWRRAGGPVLNPPPLNLLRYPSRIPRFDAGLRRQACGGRGAAGSGRHAVVARADEVDLQVRLDGGFEAAQTVVLRLFGASLQEDADAIGLSLLSGAHNYLFPRVAELMKEKGMDDVLLTGGGIIPDSDVESLNQIGVAQLFPPGTSTGDIASYIEQWVEAHRA